MKNKKIYFNNNLKQNISNHTRIITLFILAIFIIGLVISKSVKAFFPPIMTRSNILNEIKNSEYVAYKGIDCVDDVDSLANPEVENILFSKGLDKDNWNKATRWSKDIIVRKYLDDSSMDDANERLAEFVAATSPTNCKVLNITPDNNGIYPVSKEIQESKESAIQVFDMYIPTNTSVSIEDLTEVMLSSKANIKLVEVKTKDRGTEDPKTSSYWEDVRYIVYNDTPSDRYETDYIVKLKISQFGVAHVKNMLVDYISRVEGVNENFADTVYVSGGSTVNDTSLFTKIKFSLNTLNGLIYGFISSLRDISVSILLGLFSIIAIVIAVCIFFPPAALGIVFALQLLVYAFYLICYVISIICKIFSWIFRKLSPTLA